MKPCNPTLRCIVAISLGAALGFSQPAHADVIKANNNTPLNLGGSYSGGVAPTGTDLLLINGTMAGAQSANLGGNVSVLGISASSANTLTINTGNTLTIGASGISSTGTGALTLNNATSLGGNITLANGATGAVSFSALTLTANQTWSMNHTTNNNRINVGGTLTTGGNTLDISGTSSAWNILNITATNTLGTNVTIGDIGRLYVQGAATVTFDGINNTNKEFYMFGGTTNVKLMGYTGDASSIGIGVLNVIQGGTTLNYTGTTASSDKSFTRNATNGNTTFKVTASGETLSVSGNLTSGGGITGGWVLGGAGNLNLSGIVNNTNSTTVTKQDAGTLILSGANTYTGATTVSQGTLLVNNTTGSGTGSGTVSVSSGGTLGGSGTIAGPTTIQSGGTHSPGNSPGLQTFGNGLTYVSGSTFVWELTGNTESGRGTSFDGVDITGGTLTIQSGVTSSLVFNGAGSSALWADGFWDSDHSWLVFDNANAPSVQSGIFGPINVSNDSGDNPFGTRGIFSWSQSGNDVQLNYLVSAVPEPGTGVTLAFAAGLLCFGSRRRRRRVLKVENADLKSIAR